MEEQKKRTAREIIENYDGPAVRMYFYIRDTSMQSRGPNFVRNW